MIVYFDEFTPSLEAESSRTEVKIAQEMLETAAAAYQPKRYDGSVLLILASERPPHLDYLPAWQKVIPSSLACPVFRWSSRRPDERSERPAGRGCYPCSPRSVTGAESDSLILVVEPKQM